MLEYAPSKRGQAGDRLYVPMDQLDLLLDRFLLYKWYFDVLYEAIFVRPAMAIGRFFWRTGDQRYYVSDTRRFTEATGWVPKVSPEEGVKLLGIEGQNGAFVLQTSAQPIRGTRPSVSRSERPGRMGMYRRHPHPRATAHQ